MARKGPKGTKSDEVAEQPSTDETPPEASSDENTEKEETPPEADLSDFQAAVSAAVEQRDEQTGELTDELLKPVVDAFRGLSGIKQYNKARSWVEDQMTEAVTEHEDVHLARTYVSVRNALTTAAPKRERQPADPTEAFVQVHYQLQEALRLHESFAPEGLAEDWPARVTEFAEKHADEVAQYDEWQRSTDENKGDAPEVHSAVRQAFKLATKKTPKRASGKTFDGPKRDTKIHVEQVFADQPVGTFMSVSQIAKADSEQYGSDHPSAGAINQRLFPKGEKAPDLPEGIEADADNKPRGARKVA
jgi:hypothetical protein